MDCDLDASASTFGLAWGYAAVNLDATIRVTLSAPSPISGRLALQYSTNSTFSSTTRVDVDGDGTFELSATSATNQSTTAATFEIPLVITSTRDIDFVFDVSAMALAQYSTVYDDAESFWRATWFTDQPAIQEFATTGSTADLLFTHTANNDLDLEVRDTAGQLMPGLLLVGLQPTNTQLSPTLTQLVTADILLASSQVSAPLPTLPPGWELYVQGIGIDNAGTWFGTRSLRVIWP